MVNSDLSVYLGEKLPNLDTKALLKSIRSNQKLKLTENLNVLKGSLFSAALFFKLAAYLNLIYTKRNYNGGVKMTYWCSSAICFCMSAVYWGPAGLIPINCG